MAYTRKTTEHVPVKAPNLVVTRVKIVGEAPLVIHRFSAKTKAQMKQKMELGSVAGTKRNREAKNTDDTFHEARYFAAVAKGKEQWEGFHASAMRNAMISACRLVNFKMTMAKLSLFVLADGYDKFEPQVPLIRIIGKAEKQEDMARVETGQPYVTVRARYWPWSANVTLRFDADQFSHEDLTNLLLRVGKQVGIGEGRPDSKNSAGMGWGLFSLQG